MAFMLCRLLLGFRHSQFSRKRELLYANFVSIERNRALRTSCQDLRIAKMSSVTGMMTRAAVVPKEGHGTHLATSWQGKQKIEVSVASNLCVGPPARSVWGSAVRHFPDSL